MNIGQRGPRSCNTVATGPPSVCRRLTTVLTKGASLSLQSSMRLGCIYGCIYSIFAAHNVPGENVKCSLHVHTLDILAFYHCVLTVKWKCNSTVMYLRYTYSRLHHPNLYTHPQAHDIDMNNLNTMFLITLIKSFPVVCALLHFFCRLVLSFNIRFWLLYALRI